MKADIRFTDPGQKISSPSTVIEFKEWTMPIPREGDVVVIDNQEGDVKRVIWLVDDNKVVVEVTRCDYGLC